MKNVVAAALVAGSTVSASAADLQRGAPPPYMPPSPVFTWAGFYVGLNAGYSWTSVNNHTTGAPVAFDPGPGFISGGPTALGLAFAVPSFSSKPRGFLGGGQAGYNWQSGAGVFGFEMDLQGVSARRDNAFASQFTPSNLLGIPFGTASSVSNRLDYLGTVRGRVGHAFDNPFLFGRSLLFYGTGGLAYGGVRTSVASFDRTLAPTGGITTTSSSAAVSASPRVGWTVGGGLEWMLLPNVSLKAEYLHYDLGRQSVVTNATFFETGAGGTGVGSPYASAARLTSVRWKGDVVRAGVNYHFDWVSASPVIARY